MNIGHYTKFIVMAVFGTVSAFIAANSDGVLTQTELINVGVAFGGALLVFVVPNLPVGLAKYTKLGIAALTAAAVVAVSALTGDNVIDLNEWLQVTLAAAGALGLYVLPNEPKWENQPVLAEPRHLAEDSIQS